MKQIKGGDRDPSEEAEGTSSEDPKFTDIRRIRAKQLSGGNALTWRRDSVPAGSTTHPNSKPLTPVLNLSKPHAFTRLSHICRISVAYLSRICRISVVYLLHICCISVAYLPLLTAQCSRLDPSVAYLAQPMYDRIHHVYTPLTMGWLAS